MLHALWNIFIIRVVAFLASEILATPLDDYVYRKDPAYKYDVIKMYQMEGYTLYILNLTSQKWKPDFQSQPVWWHYLSVTVPDKILIKGAGFLYITGGSNNDNPPSLTDPCVQGTTHMATATGSIGACLTLVPNTPIVFKNDPAQKERWGDAIVAWTWKTFVEQKGVDPEILLTMPMTKASVRALDTISDLTKSKIGEKTDRFVVAGKSKRGGISWMVGAVDKRVVAIVPIVMDLLNMQENLRHYYRSLGGWSFAFNDYYEVNFTQYLDSPYLKQMATIVDPLSYTHRYGDKPKYIILAGNDELFMPDDSRFYFDDLKGEIYFRMAPNMDHTLNPFENNTALGIRSFYISIMKNIPLPKMNWKLQMTSTGGKISLITEKRPAAVVCYHATTTDGKRKDFRLFRLNNDNVPALNQVIWHKADVNQTVTFAGLADSVLEFTTQTLIIPDTYPFPDCHGAECRGTLV
ncbi:autocrine proliferation repressor protein A-like isoform X2 [Dreissena polymorpha]|uniref:autocrine proliferation repressor protein A-like isoform X2 n=1 Tax=Dreissena polymorpha TaxID=45954 RepID=UPI002263ECB2|nr:autocrine proliferation repressor protein A-like isoform X2 [Dreissena polymorpha]